MNCVALLCLLFIYVMDGNEIAFVIMGKILIGESAVGNCS